MKYCKDCMIINLFGEKRYRITMNILDMTKAGKPIQISHAIDNKKYLITITFAEVEEGD